MVNMAESAVIVEVLLRTPNHPTPTPTRIPITMDTTVNLTGTKSTKRTVITVAKRATPALHHPLLRPLLRHPLPVPHAVDPLPLLRLLLPPRTQVIDVTVLPQVNHDVQEVRLPAVNPNIPRRI